MKITEFTTYLEERKITLSSAAVGGGGAVMPYAFSPMINLLREDWKRVKKDIEPHFFGEMPEAVKEAFPNEKPSQQAYRKRIHTSPTKDKLWKAITDVNRIIMSANFVLNYGPKLDKFLQANPRPFNGYSLSEYLGVVLYPERVLDPNGFYAVLPTNLADMIISDTGELVSNPNSLNRDLGVKIMYYPSQNLLYSDSELMIFAEYKLANTTIFAGGLPLASLCYRVLTKNSTFLIDPSETDSTLRYLEYFETPNRDEIPAGVLGGRWIPRIDQNTNLDGSYFESDFSFAVPVMVDLNVVKNQHKAITCTSVFATTVVREIPCKAEGCFGGRVQTKNANGDFELDEYGGVITHACPSCNGTGSIDLSALNVIVAPRQSAFDADQKPIALSDYIHHDTPDVAAVQELGGQVEKAQEEVNQALTILQQKMVGQTAESKAADMEDKQTFLAAIAKGLARAGENILRWSSYIVLGDAAQAEAAQISVAAPQSFDIMTVEALRQMRDQNRAEKSLDTRAYETLKLVEKESDNPVKIREVELVQEYTQNRSEALLTELDSWLINEVITPREYREALASGAEIRKILRKNPEFTDEQIFSTLDKIFAKFDKAPELANVLGDRQKQQNTNQDAATNQRTE